MIARLRRRHLRSFVLLALVLALVVVLAIRARPVAPLAEALPAGVVTSEPAGGEMP